MDELSYHCHVCEYFFIYIVVDMYGLSDHDLMFTKEDEELDGDENVEYIEERLVIHVTKWRQLSVC